MCVGVHAPARVSVCLTLHIAIHRHTRTHTRARKARSLMGQMICVVYSHVYSAQDLCLRSVCFAAASSLGELKKHSYSRKWRRRESRGRGRGGRSGRGWQGLREAPLWDIEASTLVARQHCWSLEGLGKMPPGVPPTSHLGYGPGGLGVNSEPSRCPPPPTGLPSPGFSGPKPGASERRAARGA